ncbi:MAG: imidazolonepropionase, partial [Bacteroidota bacterium]
MPVLTDIATLATCRADGGQAAIHAISDAALVWDSATIRWVGTEAALPAEYAAWERQSAGRRLAT